VNAVVVVKSDATTAAATAAEATPSTLKLGHNKHPNTSEEMK